MGVFDNVYITQRIQKANDLRKQHINPYTNSVSRTMNNHTFLQTYAYLLDRHHDSLHDVAKDSATQSTQSTQESSHTSTHTNTPIESLVGRVKFMRIMGRACFLKIHDESATIQVYISKNDVSEQTFFIIKKLLEVGDIINVSGYAFVTKTGELSIHASACNILTKAIIPLPEKFHGLTDIEARYRQRYVDLIVNPQVKDVFFLRSRIIRLVRGFFEERGFIEVETPMLHPIPGGANAKPFSTYHNALHVHRYLRIAPELYLKRLIVGGFEAVFELNRNFRNEGMDHSHNPEFSMIEFYWAYHTYEDVMHLTKELLLYVLHALELPTMLPCSAVACGEVDMSKWSVIGYKESLVNIGGIPESHIHDASNLSAYLQAQGVQVDAHSSLAMLYDVAFSELVESKLINPTFITQYPIELSPLARRNDEDPTIADRFELFIAGKEIANGFSELNDPLDQYERFCAQVKAKEAGDEEAQYMDEDFLQALGYGMPPTAGEGIGIDRLVMLLTNSKSIKDVLLFPAMKPIAHESSEH